MKTTLLIASDSVRALLHQRILLGLMLIGYGRWRGREVDEAISHGGYRSADERFLTVIAARAAVGMGSPCGSWVG